MDLPQISVRYKTTAIDAPPFAHQLKILPEYFEQVMAGNKWFELRKDDRDYKVGDYIILREWDGSDYTGRNLQGISIRYILRNVPEYGLMDGYCILGF